MLGRGRSRWLGTCGLWAVLSGCAHLPRSSPDPIDLRLPLVQRGRVEAQIETLPQAPANVATSATDPYPAASYHALSAGDVQRLAAAHAPGASLHLAEALGTNSRRHAANMATPAGRLRCLVLLCTAAEIQNRAVGAALEAYFRLAEMEGKTDLLDESIAQLEIARRETRDMLQQQLKPPVDIEVWSRQLQQAQSDRLRAQLAIEELNSQLRRMLGWNPGGTRERLWNPDAYHVHDEPIDIDAAVQLAWSQRAELRLIRAAIASLSPQTIGVIDEVLKSNFPLLGQNSAGPVGETIRSLGGFLPSSRGAIEQRRQQLTDWLAQREAAIAEEVRQAVAAMRYHGRVVALAWQRERSYFQAVEDARNRQKQGLASFAELTERNLEWIKARSEVLQATMAWYIARVHVWQAQGLLAEEPQPACASARTVPVAPPQGPRISPVRHCR